jgi:hypothetical protein
MIFDAIAVIVLSGMMLVPLINLVVGLIVGAWLGGPAGVPAGLALAVLISLMEKRLGDRLGWFEPIPTAEGVRPLHKPEIPSARLSFLRVPHPVISTPVYFTEPAPPVPPLMASVLSEPRNDAPCLLN